MNEPEPVRCDAQLDVVLPVGWRCEIKDVPSGHDDLCFCVLCLGGGRK